MTTTTSHVPTVTEVLADPAASYWLKFCLKAVMYRDPVDAANDAELMAAVLKRRADEALSEGMGVSPDKRGPRSSR